jgi:hypothetical protein
MFGFSIPTTKKTLKKSGKRVKKTKKQKKNTQKNTQKDTQKATTKDILSTKPNPDICNPAVVQNKKGKSISCFDFDSLVKIVNGWNQQHPDDTVKIPKIKNESNKKKLWKEIDRRLKGKCTSEWCWIEQEFVKRVGSKELESNFRPKMPRSWKKNPYEWLSSVDIQSVMEQYEEKYPEFYFIGPVPIDFDYRENMGQCVVNELCNISITDLLKKNTTKVGIIFNLDKHDQPGSHWIAFFMDIKEHTICFFDSYGHEPPNEIKVLIDRLQKQASELPPPDNFEFTYNCNKTRHQYEHSECGVYSIYFVIQLLEKKKTFAQLEQSRIPDEFVNKKRKYFFLSE